MSQDAMQSGTDPEKVLPRAPDQGTHPATPAGASVGFTDDGKVVNQRAFAMAGGEAGVAELREENRRRQMETLKVVQEPKTGRRRPALAARAAARL
jgi:hypothetical protein